MKKDFWKVKKLNEMTREEWEALCDGCGVCCLEKLEDEDTGEIIFTNVACSHLDTETCKCFVYEERYKKAPECFDLSPENIDDITWLPATCAYRRLNEGKQLYWWHYLITGNRESVSNAGVSVKDRAVKNDD